MHSRFEELVSLNSLGKNGSGNGNTPWRKRACSLKFLIVFWVGGVLTLMLMLNWYINNSRLSLASMRYSILSQSHTNGASNDSFLGNMARLFPAEQGSSDDNPDINEAPLLPAFENLDECWMSRDNALENGAIAMDNPMLLDFIKTKYLDVPLSTLNNGPEPVDWPYNLTNASSKYFSQINQDIAIEKLFKGKRNGIFIEAGAQNGEIYSNTLYLERNLGWTGLLVEPSPINYKVLRSKNRRSFTVNAGLSPKPYPTQFEFNGHQIMDSKVNLTSPVIMNTVQCFPLYSLLLAANLTEIDYFSLDVDGPEFDILQTIPWGKILIRALSVEFRHSPFPVDLILKRNMVEYMATQNYSVHSEIIFDLIFVKNGTL